MRRSEPVGEPCPALERLAAVQARSLWATLCARSGFREGGFCRPGVDTVTAKETNMETTRSADVLIETPKYRYIFEKNIFESISSH